MDVFESLITSEMIISPEPEDTYNEEAQQWTSRIVRRTMFNMHEDDVDDYYLPDKQYKVLIFLSAVVHMHLSQLPILKRQFRICLLL